MKFCVVIVYSFYVICFNPDFDVDNLSLLLFWGLVLLMLASIIHIKTYQPKIIIAKRVKMLGNRTLADSKWKFVGYDLVIGILVGIVLLIMENVIFAQK